MFDDRLKLLRENAGKNCKETAKSLGLKYTTYINYETNAREPPFETLIKIADHYGVSIDYLLGHQTDKAQKEQRKKLNELELTLSELLLELRKLQKSAVEMRNILKTL